ncbi:MAG TPA: IS66 family transposase [Pyrinomonadaceae bacterium]|jgi:transposase
MWRDLGISEQDWKATPLAVRTALLGLQQQVRLMGIRFSAYEKQLAGLREQVATVDDLKAEIAELHERLGQNSSNSSKPPSSDPPSYKPDPKRKPQGRKRGGQPGHQGSTRRLLPAEEVDHLVELKPASCAGCGRKLRGADPAPERRQVSEVPPVRAEVTEYRRHGLRCAACGALTHAAWPAGVTGTSFGARAQAVVGYLTGRLGASHRDVTEVMSVVYGLGMSTGSVSSIQRQVSAALAAPAAEAARFARQQVSQHVDETGWRECGHRKWLWVNATRDVTTFEVLDARSAEAARHVISAEAQGVVTTDRYWSYNWLPGRRRQVCWAHLARDFQAMVERGGESEEIGEALFKQSRRLFSLWHKARDGDLSRGQLAALMKSVRRKVKKLLQAGAGCEQKKTRRTCANILAVERSLWTFLRVEGVEPTNNAAERALRRAVLWRRKSFGTQSAAGSRFVGRVLTAVTSLRQQGRDVLEYLAGVCRSALAGGAHERLIPTLSPLPT